MPDMGKTPDSSQGQRQCMHRITGLLIQTGVHGLAQLAGLVKRAVCSLGTDGLQAMGRWTGGMDDGLCGCGCMSGGGED